MAAYVTLRVAESNWVKKWPTWKSPQIAAVWSSWWTVSQTQCGECFPPAQHRIPVRAWSPSSRTKRRPKSWRLPAFSQSSPETQRCCGEQERRQKLLLLTAFTNGHLLRMVVSECLLYGLIKSSVGPVRAIHMVRSLLWIYKMLYSVLYRLSNQNWSLFWLVDFFFFSSSPNWTVRTVGVMFCKSKLWSVGMT